MGKTGMNPICPKCMGWMHLKQQIYDKKEIYKCDLCGYTVIVIKKEITPL